MGKAIGIDLGTTNTAVAVLVDGRPRVLEDDKGYKVLPSCVSLKGDGSRVVGQAARNLVITNPHQTAYAIKRLMGRRFDTSEVAEVQKSVSYQIAAADDGLCKVKLGDEWFTPVELSAVILTVAREMAERSLGEPVDEAVITVPAYFNHAQRSATFDAARLAGLRCERLLNEPTAAALAYGYRKDVERRLVVYDLGGGTFDVSVLQLARGIYEVLATSGETHLGGEDFDQRLVDHLSDDFQAKTGVDPRTDPTALQRLKDAAERAKCELSFTDRTSVLIPMITMADSLEASISRLTMEELVGDLIDRTLEITREAITAAGLRISDVDDVILVGGQTRMPRVREAIRSLFQKEPSRSVHPEEVVAIGAAVHATSLVSDDIHQPLLLDVTPFDLGMDVSGGLFKRVIAANSQVPASFTETFATTRDGQKFVRVTVRQGSSPTAAENEFLGEFVMSGLTPAPRMETKVDVTFKIDSNGMLHVSALEQGSGERKRITIRNYAEFVQGDGSVQPDLEGDIGGPDPIEAARLEAEAEAERASSSPGFLRRIFGRSGSSKPAASPEPEPAAPEASEAPPLEVDPGSMEGVDDGGAVPEMPAFLQELDASALTDLGPIDEDEGSSGLDAVGFGLDDLGFDDLAPLSMDDLTPSAAPASASPPAADDGFGADADEGVFALPPPDEDDDYFDDEDFLDDEGFVAEADDGFLDDTGSFDDAALDAALGAALEAAAGSADEADPGADEVFALTEPEDQYDDEEDEDDDPFGADFVDDAGVSAEWDVAERARGTDDDAIDEVEVFAVDDSTRSLVEPIGGPSLPLPDTDAEDLIWGDELADDGTVEFTADGATATPRPYVPETDEDDEEHDFDAPVDTLLEELDTLTGAAPVTSVDPFEDAPTDPPLEPEEPQGPPARMRLDFSSPAMLADDLITGLRRGGAWIATPAPLASGRRCVLELAAPGVAAVEVDAVVAWSTSGGSEAGMEVEYIVDRHRRRALVAELEAFLAR